MTKSKDPIAEALKSAKSETLAVRAGQVRTHADEHSEALFLTSSYVFDNCEDAAARFSGENDCSVYTRYTNPTVRNFEQRLAALEGAEDCVATSSGMGAIMSLCLAQLRSGDHIICSSDVFGSTVVLLNNFFAKFGVEISYAKLTDMDAWRSAIKDNTRFLFIETPSNPLSHVGDIAAFADLAHQHNLLLVVDNCFCSPALQKPLELGADIIIHSATKYIDGQGRCLGGAVLGAEQHIESVRSLVRAGGPSLSPFNAWVFLKGLETLHLRMRAHSDNALAIAQWLEQQPTIEKVFYTGLSSHPQHQLAAAQQSQFGGVLSFRIRGDKSAAWRFINATQMISLTANLGDAKTTIVHPASTTHSRLSDLERSEAGITDNLIRVAVGLEAVEDIMADLSLGLATLNQ
ncbi:MAG: O-succinylhomoserine sulfhydrylase [Cellvibrionales bacterium]|jgi:O-succinylhomoserine sulfhydrylase|nr:O-succinylhomoserine sulfhydrylase [Cellvibrionales bacterium]HCH21251.1 O-succinylhomoserine sulfhydrylase [Cellvibrionales bacterium]